MAQNWKVIPQYKVIARLLFITYTIANYQGY